MAKAGSRHWQQSLHEIIFESHTRAGKTFDIGLLICILLSIAVVMADSVNSLHIQFGKFFYITEWILTGLFTLEYVLRLMCVRKPAAYALSFLGMVDLLAILPTFVSLFLAGAQSLLVLRALRLLRVFRIFKLSHYMAEMRFLGVSLKASAIKISIFMLVVFALVVILGSVMYLVEKGENGFSSIPDSIYWAIVTITTVGYGDISPVTPLGKLFASIIMFLGYSIIAVPTGIVTTEMALAVKNKEQSRKTCSKCRKEGHDADARFCKFCGSGFEE